MRHFGVLPASIIILCGALAAAAPSARPRRELRVCADPNNLPFSNARLEGFENRIAAIVAKAIDADLSYTFWPQRRGFVRHTLQAGRCDVLLGVPKHTDGIETTRPYYRSTYAFLFRKGQMHPPESWNDPALGKMRIGVQLVGDDYANTPPVHVLSRAGFGANLVGFTVYGDYASDVPGRPILDAVSQGAIDLAAVWGPLAGYGVTHDAALALAPVPPANDAGLSMAFDIAMAVRKGDHELARELDAALRRLAPRIDAVLRSHGVPFAPAASP
jgi:mxaJ protein